VTRAAFDRNEAAIRADVAHASAARQARRNLAATIRSIASLQHAGRLSDIEAVDVLEQALAGVGGVSS
jgi:hypothetical protein